MHTNYAANAATKAGHPSTASAEQSHGPAPPTFDDKEEKVQMLGVLKSIKDLRKKKKAAEGWVRTPRPFGERAERPSFFSMDSRQGIILKMFSNKGEDKANEEDRMTDPPTSLQLEEAELSSSSQSETDCSGEKDDKVPDLLGAYGSSHSKRESSYHHRRKSMERYDSEPSLHVDDFIDQPYSPLRSVQRRRTTMDSMVSDITCHDGYDIPTEHHSIPIDVEEAYPRKEMTKKLLTSPNDPNPALDFPPLYFLVKNCPRALDAVQSFYKFRWRVSYPLQKRVLFSKVLRKARIYFTWGELLLLLPFFVALVVCTLYSFVSPSVSVTGHACRTPLIIAFATAAHNSIFTLLLGIPFERALWYHKLAGRVAFVNAILHTYVSFWYPVPHALEAYDKSKQGENTDLVEFSFADQVNTGGSMLLVFMAVLLATSVPFIRRKVFEVFYYIHIVFAVAMIGCAFYHTGVLVPILASVVWGGDVLLRKVFMASVRYPRKASIRLISDTVVELSFPKSEGFDFNPGQYIYLAVPELSLFEWHPFSLSSSPRQKLVTLHIRKAGAWTSSLFDLAKSKKEISILFEGPYGSLGVDLMNRDRYKMVMLFSGGIGVTPGQSICNQLLYEHSTKQRQLKKLSFIWIERDPVVMKKVEVMRRTSSVRYSVNLNDPELRASLERSQRPPSVGLDEEGAPMGLASTILSLVPASRTTDEQLENEYPKSEEFDVDDDKEYDADNVSLKDLSGILHNLPRLRNRMRSNETEGRSAVEVTDVLGEEPRDGDSAKYRRRTSSLDGSNSFATDGGFEDGSTIESSSPERQNKSDFSVDDTFLDKAYNAEAAASPNDVFDLQVYLTEQNTNSHIAHLPFVQTGRPDIKQLFLNMKEEAIFKGERRVAVCVCAPLRVVELCRKACTKYSDKKVCFDFHEEIFS